jgi:hypothetical protein
MTDSTFQFDFKELNLTVSQIENIIGFNEGDDRQFVTDLIGELLNDANKICTIKAQVRIFDNIHFNRETTSVEINNMIFHIKKIVFSQLKKSEAIAIFLCTAGDEIGRKSRQAMQERDLLRGYIYDVIGSEIVEAAADMMQGELEKSVALSSRKLTNRYSPGYCGWDVAEQNKLFSLIPDNYCGIRLTPSSLMDPVKSISGFIGIGEHVKSNPYTCKMCEIKDCTYRRIREKTF